MEVSCKVENEFWRLGVPRMYDAMRIEAGKNVTEPSAVAPDPRVSLNNSLLVNPRIACVIIEVDSGIRRYRARFCTGDLLRDLTIFPGNRLEALKGNRKGQHSIRINDQYRICFV